MALVDINSGDNCLHEFEAGIPDLFPVDQQAVARWLDAIVPQPIPPAKSSVDPVAEHFARVLNCPRLMLEIARVNARRVSLDSTCNL